MTTALNFATVRNGKIVAINQAYPPHELKPNQFALEEDEFYLLKAVNNKDPKADIMDVLAEIQNRLALKMEEHNAKNK